MTTFHTVHTVLATRAVLTARAILRGALGGKLDAQWWRESLHWMIALFYPHLCPECRETMGNYIGFCSSCARTLRLLGDECCQRCGVPMAPETSPDGRICLGCVNRKVAYQELRAAAAYQEGIRRTILGLKHGDRFPLTSVAAQLMDHRIGEWRTHIDIIVPVPLHDARLRKRRYNQSALIADALVRLWRHRGWTTPQHLPAGLLRVRNTPSQKGLRAAQRHRNVSGAIALNPKALPLIRHQRILVIDDVITTGATVMECAKVLDKAGAHSVKVASLAVRTR